MTKRKLLKTITLTLSLFLLAPIANKVQATEDSQPTIVAEAGIIMDYDTGEIIYEKNANDKKYIASTTKLMTAILFAEHNSKNDILTYTKNAKSQPPYTLQSHMQELSGKTLNIGDKLSADIAMKSLLIYSANDVAYMISDEVAGSTESFAKMMNDKAAELGLTSTHFENPNGLASTVTNQDVNYSTAYELALIMKEAYQHEWIKDTVSLSSTYIDLPQNVRIELIQRNTELGSNGNLGGKTGFTNMAGNCFAGVYERNGKKYLTVVLKSTNVSDASHSKIRFEDIDKMMDYSENASRKVYKSSGEEVGTTELEYKAFGFFGPKKTISAPIVLSEDVQLYDNNINNNETIINIDSKETSAWKAASSDKVPLTVNVKQFSTTVNGKIDISTFTLIKANILLYVAIIVLIGIIAALVIFIIRMINSRKRRRSSYRRRY